jgi:serine/threonine protein kinase
MSLASGTRIGPYEITGVLGAGGMGEVYRAHDARLARDVALKVLPEVFAADPERLARFQREAQVLAALKHPNVGAIYGLEEGALVLELVEGETLADRIARDAIPMDEALPIAKQIAEALQAAHEQGIVHRDLKPSNIKVQPDGCVKVLDFGLAKLTETAGAREASRAGEVPLAHLSMSPTLTSPAATGVGVMLGTAAYMAPEQEKGRPADKRSDVWEPTPLFDSGSANLNDVPAHAYAVSSDGQRFLIPRPASSVVSQPSSPIAVVLNWAQGVQH